MYNLAVILHQNVIGYSEIIKNDRNAESILRTLSEEMGELATEVSIHIGHSYKSSGSDGVLGEAIDIIAAASDLSYCFNLHDHVESELDRLVCLKQHIGESSDQHDLSNLYLHMMMLQGSITERYIFKEINRCNRSRKNNLVDDIARLIFNASEIIESVCSDRNEGVSLMVTKLEKWKQCYSLPEGYSIGTWEDDGKEGYIFYTDEHGIPPVEVYETKKEAMKAAWSEYNYSK